MYDFLAGVGIFTLAIMACFIIIGLYMGAKELIDRLKWRYRYKHRFDKPPTAKCYCIDCKHHNNESNRCYRFDFKTGYQCTADNWFCWEAEPRKGETK